jgi:predicted ATP-dependent endonuclease of OLD family
MINGISIENFRCFNKTDIQGFGLVNLIGGKNNVGKTSLLEAFIIGLTPEPYNNLQSMRLNNYKIDDEFIFRNQIDTSIVKFIFHLENEKLYNVNFQKGILSPRAELSIKGEIQPFIIDKGIELVSLISDKDKQYPQNLILSKEFDIADRAGESDEILKALKVIDTRIDEIKTYSDRPDIIHLKLIGEKERRPIFFFGDAIQKVMRYIITIIKFHNFSKGNSKILLIDEIENGLHYTVQEDFWEMVFKLAIAYDIQIFAATHSLEMIKAFAKISMKYDNKAAYFEMFRHIKTDEIAANRILPEALNYKLEHNRPLRGE